VSETGNLQAKPIMQLNVGVSTLPGVYPRFKGTKLLRPGVYGLMSDETSDHPENHSKTGVNAALKSAFNWAVDNNVDIWMLPEMCVDAKDLELLLLWLKAGSGSIKMVQPGTTYVKSGNGYHNHAPIWQKLSSGTWRTDDYYDKKVPFEMNINTNAPGDTGIISREAQKAGATILEEDFIAGTKLDTGHYLGNNENIWHGVAICRDVLDVFDSRNPLIEYLKRTPDIMYVTSMNSGHTNLFVASAEAMARWHTCATVYVNNSTSVGKSDDIVEMAFALLPNVSKVAGISGRIYYMKSPRLTAGSECSAPVLLSETDTAYEQRVSALYSSSVTAHPLPQHGNVLFKIRGSMLE
jgi:hypothetical protein